MSRWVARTRDAQPGDLSLQVEVAKPEYASLTDQQVADTLNAQIEPDPSPVDMSAVRRTAIENRVWGKLEGFASRVTGTTAAQNTLTWAARNFMSLFREGGSVVLIRGNALWNAMDADLTDLVSTNGGGPVLTVAQANFMRAYGDRTRPKWEPSVGPAEVFIARMP